MIGHQINGRAGLNNRAKTAMMEWRWIKPSCHATGSVFVFAIEVLGVFHCVGLLFWSF